MVKINLGCGKDYKKGWVNVDDCSMAICKVDVKKNILKYTHENDTVDYILLSHVAMYLRPEDMVHLLSKCYLWLKKGGIIEVETIDLDKVMKFALEGRTDSWSLANIFGTPETGPHRWGWSVHKLKKLMQETGFKSIVKRLGSKKPKRDYKLIAKK